MNIQHSHFNGFGIDVMFSGVSVVPNAHGHEVEEKEKGLEERMQTKGLRYFVNVLLMEEMLDDEVDAGAEKIQGRVRQKKKGKTCMFAVEMNTERRGDGRGEERGNAFGLAHSHSPAITTM